MNINKLIEDMEVYAKERNVPIMVEPSLLYILDYIKNNNIKSVLEIGTAIGYSAIRMCDAGAKVTTIERDKTRYEKALENVKKAGMESDIKLIFSDAFDTNITSKFDLILIDAAKGKNKEFVDKFKCNLNNNAIIIIDNVDFHGYVHNSESIKSRNLRSLVRKIERFLDYLDNQSEFIVSKVNLGDGLIVLKENK